MSSMDRVRGSRAHRTATLFLPVSTDLIARLEAIVEAGIELLDEIEGDADLEPSIANPCPHIFPADSEGDDADAENSGDEHEPQFGASADVNQVAGWFTVGEHGSDGCEIECEDEGAQADDEGFVEQDDEVTAPSTPDGLAYSARFNEPGDRAAHRALFDPRFARRGDRRLHAGAPRHLPTFPHEPADRAGFDKREHCEEIEAFIRQAHERRAMVAGAGGNQWLGTDQG